MATRRNNNNRNHALTRNDKFEDIQTRKIISAYGGIGSIIETRNGSILIEPFEDWDFYKEKKHLDPQFHIEDRRFFYRLRQWFGGLKALVQVPSNSRNEAHFPSENHNLITASFFPKWMFCSKCKRFDHLDNWLRLWECNVNQNHKFDINPPKCFKCYTSTKGNKRFFELEQVRFILISANGEIGDIPWDKWVFARISSKELKAQQKENGTQKENEDNEEDKLSWLIDFNAEIRQDVYYQYLVSDKFNDLKGISIVAKEINSDKEVKRQTLQGVFNLRVPENKIVGSYYDRVMKPVIRSSNSVYYPNIISSLFLPTEQPKSDIDDNVINAIKGYQAANLPTETILQLLASVQKITISQKRLENLIANNFVEDLDNSQVVALLEVEYRLKEYEFITSKTARYDDGDKNRLIFEPIPKENVGMKHLKIFRMDRLKMTSVQTSYTRTEPIDKDYYLQEGSGETSTFIRKKYTSNYGKNAHYLPAIESYGEGIFIEFSKESIDNWQKKNKEVIEQRSNAIQKNYDETKGIFRPNRKIDAKLILIHTFSHLIIKELEFLCGYPATSLQERLYVSDDMQGILIYTIAGTEGSYGGLTSICKSDKIGKVIKSSLHRATDCASDPICYETDLNQGQGVGGTNLAACYSCALLPETSCEEFNSFLDRALVIDEKFGYFRSS